MIKMKTLKNYFTKYKYQIVTLIGHVQFFIFFAWWMIPAGIVFNNVVNYLYLHRVYTHKHYRFGEKTDLVFQFLATMLNLGAPNIYAAVHMKHHSKSDTEDDPHSPMYTPLWKMYASLWNKSFMPERKWIPKFKCVFYQHHIKIALFAAVFFPWITVIAHWMSKIVIHPVHKNGEPINLPKIVGILTWGEEQHKVHHEKNRNDGDLLDFIGRCIQYISGGKKQKHESVT